MEDYKAAVKYTVLQICVASRDLYSVQPREGGDYWKCLWLLLSAAYGLVNANEKFQTQNDETFLNIALLLVLIVS